MAVFTEVSKKDAREVLRRLQIGELVELRGIEGGIENTNYFLTSTQGEFVLTLFERLTAEQLPFYLHLMKHLAHGGIPVPEPRADKYGEILHTVAGKPAAVVSKLRGKSQLAPEPVHCAAVGAMLARMHLVGRDYDRHQPNLRGLPWWNETVPVVLPHLDAAQAALLQSELAYQNHVAASSTYAALPRGPVHADLFRDNVMFAEDTLTGFFDFYFAGVDAWLFDLAVCLNDWCIDLPTGARAGSELHHVPDAGRGVGFSTAVAAAAAACAVGRLHFVGRHVAALGLHVDALRLAAHTQLVHAAAAVFHANALSALVASATELLWI